MLTSDGAEEDALVHFLFQYCSPVQEAVSGHNTVIIGNHGRAGQSRTKSTTTEGAPQGNPVAATEITAVMWPSCRKAVPGPDGTPYSQFVDLAGKELRSAAIDDVG